VKNQCIALVIYLVINDEILSYNYLITKLLVAGTLSFYLLKSQQVYINNKKSNPLLVIVVPMLMLKCKNCGEVFAGHYVAEDAEADSISEIKAKTIQVCSRGHKNEYTFEDYMDWSGPETF
jgi:hypothetical protein